MVWSLVHVCVCIYFVHMYAYINIQHIYVLLAMYIPTLGIDTYDMSKPGTYIPMLEHQYLGE